MNANTKRNLSIGQIILNELEDERRAQLADLGTRELTERLAQENALRIDLENRLGEALACLQAAQNLPYIGSGQETLVDAAVRILSIYDPEASA